ncbi:hypothetical protein V8F06_000602 [Rhypophila decipiens]
MREQARFPVGYHPYSPRPSRYQTSESQKDMRFSQQTGAGNVPAPPPTQLGLTRYSSNPGEGTTNLDRVPIQQTQVASGSTHERGTRRPNITPPAASHAPSDQRRGRGRTHPYQSGGRQSTASSRSRARQNSVGHRGAALPRNLPANERNRWRQELIVQRRLESEAQEVEASRRENRKPNINQKVEALTVLDTQRRASEAFLAMICPGMKNSVVHPDLLRTLNLEAADLPPGMARYVPLPSGDERASRYVKLIVEKLQYKLHAKPLEFMVLDDGPPDPKILIYIGMDFLEEYCGGEFPNDAYFRSQHEEEQMNIPAATTESFGSVHGGIMAASVTGCLESYDPSIHQSQSQGIAGAPMGFPGKDTFAYRAPAPPVIRSNQPHAHQTLQGIQSCQYPIRQDVAWSSPASGTIPSDQLATWPSGTTPNDPRQYLPLPNDGTYQYVDPSELGAQFPDYTGHELFSAPQFPAPNDNHESTSGHGVGFEYLQGMGNEQFARFNHSQ